MVTTSQKGTSLQQLLDRGAKLYAAGHSAAAADIYRKALILAPDDPTARLRHAIAIWHGEDRAEEALTEIRDLAKSFPQAAVLAHEGLILNSLGRFAEGVAAARRAVTADRSFHRPGWTWRQAFPRKMLRRWSMSCGRCWPKARTKRSPAI